MDGLFNKGFRGAKCKTLLKLAIPRVKLLRNRKELQLKQMRKDVARLLEIGQEGTARIRVEHIIRENKIMEAHEIIELFCELIVVRLPIIETQRECPPDLKEAISTLCFAAPRCSDLPELLQIQMLFAVKYGKEFTSAATELMPESGVNRQIIELLSVRAPPVGERLKLLKEIAEEHNLDWDPTATEAEFMKPHEDLLNGRNQFADGVRLPLPKEKDDASSCSAFVGKPSNANSSPETGLDFVYLPTVPQSPIRPDHLTRYVPSPTVPKPSFPSEDSTTREPEPMSDLMAPHPSEVVSVLPDSAVLASSLKKNEEIHLHRESERITSGPSSGTAPRGSVSLNVMPLHPANVKAGSPSSSPLDGLDDLLLHPDEKHSDQDSYRPTKTYLDTSMHPHQNDFSSDAVNVTIVQKEKHGNREGMPGFNSLRNDGSISKARIDVANDLQDVLLAARQAAETAERAADAARLAATLARAKIAELYKKTG